MSHAGRRRYSPEAGPAGWAGGAKPLLDVGGVPIVERQRAMFATLGVVPRLVAADPAPLAHLGLEMVADLVDGGALGGLCTALETAVDRGGGGAGRRHAVPDRDVRRRAARRIWAGHDAALPRTAADGWHPLAAAYRRRVAPRLRAGSTGASAGSSPPSPRLDVAVLDDTVLAPTGSRRDAAVQREHTGRRTTAPGATPTGGPAGRMTCSLPHARATLSMRAATRPAGDSHALGRGPQTVRIVAGPPRM